MMVSVGVCMPYRELTKANNGTEESQKRPSALKEADLTTKRKVTGANPFAKKAKAALS